MTGSGSANREGRHRWPLSHQLPADFPVTTTNHQRKAARRQQRKCIYQRQRKEKRPVVLVAFPNWKIPPRNEVENFGGGKSPTENGKGEIGSCRSSADANGYVISTSLPSPLPLLLDHSRRKRKLTAFRRGNRIRRQKLRDKGQSCGRYEMRRISSTTGPIMIDVSANKRGRHPRPPDRTLGKAGGRLLPEPR